MNETRCRYDAETRTYVQADGETCDLPKSAHCSAKRSCGNHLGWGEMTCARCVGRTRTDIRVIVMRSAELIPEALVSGVESEAFSLAGPGADYQRFSARRLIDKQWIQDHLPEKRQEQAMGALLQDDDGHHPFSVLTRWAWMIATDYDLTEPDVWTISNASDLLERELTKIAQDEDQDFPLMAREIRKCRTHLENVLRDSQTPERGVPCPTCQALPKDKGGAIVRLHREYSHWCEDEACERVHYADDRADWWQCPRVVEHRWDIDSYEKYLTERKGA